MLLLVILAAAAADVVKCVVVRVYDAIGYCKYYKPSELHPQNATLSQNDVRMKIIVCLVVDTTIGLYLSFLVLLCVVCQRI